MTDTTIAPEVAAGESATAAMHEVDLTATAADKVRSLLEQEGRDDLRLRVAVQPGGCSGLIYQLYFDERLLDGDATRDFDGVEVVVDKMSVPYLLGASIDFEDTIQKQGFTIDNPNARARARAETRSTEPQTHLSDRAFAGRRAPFVVIDSEGTSSVSPRGILVRPQRRSRLARWALVPIGLVVSIVLAGCTQQQLQGYLPGDPGVTNHTGRIIGLWTTSWIVLLAVGVVTWGLIIWAAVAYRRRKGQIGLPVQLRYNLPIEIFYTIVPLILVLGFFAFTARDQTEIEANNDPEVTIQVIGKRWAWDFNYVDADVYSAGIQAQDLDSEPGAISEADLPVLYLPVGKRVEINIESRDVIHSFWILDFLYKKDMIPAKSNYLYFVPLEGGHLRTASARSSAASTTRSCSSP